MDGSVIAGLMEKGRILKHGRYHGNASLLKCSLSADESRKKECCMCVQNGKIFVL